MLLECMAIVLLSLYTATNTDDIGWWYGILDILSVAFMLVTAIVTFWARRLIRKWKANELSHHKYSWNFRDEGLFLLFWIA